MPSVCFYFQVHQPFRIRRFRFAEVGHRHRYFDDERNALILDKVARKCYLKTNAVLKKMIEEWDGRFRISFSISGVALEQMRLYAPEVLESFQSLVKTGHVELLGETFHHSLAALYDETEFVEQVRLHREAMRDYFDATPVVFRNTELI
ncbi:MAG: alpha-amylase, partial [Bdellovibrionota bacterium]